jgi:hypothetical protein
VLYVCVYVCALSHPHTVPYLRIQHHGQGNDSHGQRFKKFDVTRVQRLEHPQVNL